MTIWDLHVHLSGVPRATPTERRAQIPDAAKQLILCGNLKRLLTPILQRKGIQP